MIVVLLNGYIAILALFLWMRWLPFNLFWKISPAIVLVILLVGLFIPMGWGAPSGPAGVVRNSVQVVPNVSGEVIDVAAKANVPVKRGTVLFRIDPAPFEYKVRALKAEVVAAQQKAAQLKASLDAANASVEAVTAQVNFARKRRDDIAQLARNSTATEFRLQDAQKQVDTLEAQLSAARASQTSAELAVASQIDGVNTDVARLDAQLGSAQWDLDQTTVRAPTDGYVTNLALQSGARATSQAPVMAFIDTSTPVIGAEIGQIYARYVEPGQPAEITFKILPGRIFTGRVEAVLQAISTGQVQPGGFAVTPTDIQPAPFVVRIVLDDHTILSRLPAGATGTAAIYTEHVQPAHIIRQVVLRQTAILNYVLPF